MPRVLVFGAGGHAKVVVETLLLNPANTLVGIIDRDGTREGADVLGVRVLGGPERIADVSVDSFCVGIGTTGTGQVRQRVFEDALARGLAPVTALHPSATVSRFAEIGAGTVVMAGAIVNPGCRVGRNVIVNTGAVIDHDCRIADHAHVAPGATLSGGVIVGCRALIGVGATVRQGISIADDAIVGAGAVVVRDVAKGSTVMGVPARSKAAAHEEGRRD